jgi:GNAT superfamily N-acetyltransferase
VRRAASFSVINQGIEAYVIIRPAARTDGIEVVHLANSLSSVADALPEVESHFNALLEVGGHRVWVAEIDGAIVGWLHAFVALRVGVAPFVEIGGLVVKEDGRRAQVGSKLVREAAEWAKSGEWALRVRCNSIREPAHCFYQAIGFQYLKKQHVFEFNL